jgi:hypothetical protein
MKRSAINDRTVIMAAEEFKKFLVGKTVYHHVASWIKKWPKDDLLAYFPSGGFVMDAKHKLVSYNEEHHITGYGKDCLGSKTRSGRPYWTLNRWKVAIVKRKNSATYYVTKCADGGF